MAQNERRPEEKYDVVIVGSGPATASAARALNGRDVKTLIVERERLPRYKMCSGILFPSAIKLIAEDFGETPAGRLRRD
jgi:flavin-dependent dehydrogenase